ncbi:MAG: IclR family transcriptional regulator [Frankiales bacterium]|nr:IclR family transcriptional regulator [Frankiales bacterium]
MGDPRHVRPSVTARALAILEAFTAERRVLTLSEISRRAGMPLTTAHRLVRELAEWGALERSDAGYRIGLRLWEVGSLAPRSVGLREAGLPFLEDLYEATHENVQLAVRDGVEVVYVERISGHGAISILSRVGGRFALHATGVGLVLLAHADPEVQEQVLALPLRRYTPYTIVDPKRLRRVLQEVRLTGVAISDRQVTPDALSVAAAVRGPGDEVVASLSIVVPSEGAEPRTLVPAVRAAARGVSRALGAPSAGSRART